MRLFQIRIIIFAIAYFTIWTNQGFAQTMDCASTVKYRNALPPYVVDEQTKSAICYSGQKYQYDVKLLSDNEYRFSFYASSVFNNNIKFKIINLITGQVLLDLPGEAAGNNTSAILQDYFDEKQKKFVHPYFDIIPDSDCSYQIIVEVGEINETAGLGNSVVLTDSDTKKGCVTIFMQSKANESFGF